MRRAKVGDVVSIYCVGMLENGEIFEETPEGEPFFFEVGSPEIIPGLSEAVIGMAEGEEKEVLLTPDKAFGPRDENLVREIPRGAISLETEPREGMMLNLIVDTPQGEMQFPALVTAVDENRIVLDLNPPLAGKNVIFRIKLLGIHDRDELELQSL
ncbi:MAG TPA: peptidylprolyl isomerase [Thermosulfurimonas dismutans]|uniref:Peptidyl-prolyl cis-trans isomerase n=1 Tax=Thermosulfurimonas dismutans TaxID=999894 RepID=A0A7C3H4C7_9BACT|nr:peptidylprolyl isomerase [Thermosulfurimonas sp.]HFC97685.1 peptidylprolyl isomerase [Thermosulfurimonas dismutans]